MVSRSTLGARAGIPARLLSVTYDRPVIIRLNYAKTRPIAAARAVGRALAAIAARAVTSTVVIQLYDKVDMKWANWKVRLGQKQDVV